MNVMYVLAYVYTYMYIYNVAILQLNAWNLSLTLFSC